MPGSAIETEDGQWDAHSDSATPSWVPMRPIAYQNGNTLKLLRTITVLVILAASRTTNN